jgi:hypothetical protein
MSLIGKKLQVIDTQDVLIQDITSGRTLFSAFTTSANLDQKATSIPISGGRSDMLKANLRSKKIITSKITVSQFELDFIAAINGVALDKTSTDTYVMGEAVEVTTNSATVTGATEILAVRNNKGEFLTIVKTDPTDVSEVKVSGTSLTFHTSFAETNVLVSYKGTVAEGKDNLTIKLNAKSFSKNARAFLTTDVYDTDTEEIVALQTTELYRINIDPQFTIDYSTSKQSQTTMNIDILVPDYLPDGTLNTKGDIGQIVTTEIDSTTP